MKTKALAIALMGLALTSPAKAEDGKNWYVSGSLGMTSTMDADYNDTGVTGDIDLDDTINFAIAAGRQVNKNIRAEVELSHRSADLDSLSINGVGSTSVGGDLKTSTIMLNGYYDFMTDRKVSPFLSAGFGLARHDGSLNAAGLSFDESDTVFAYQVGAGASYDLNPKTALFGGYRYLGSTNPDLGTLEAEYDAHEIRVGVRYNF